MNFLSQVDLLMIIRSFIGSGCLLLFHLIVFVPCNTQSDHPPILLHETSSSIGFPKG